MLPLRRRFHASLAALLVALVHTTLTASASADTNVFDGANRLRQRTTPAATTEYFYDGLGAMIRQCTTPSGGGRTCTEITVSGAGPRAVVAGESTGSNEVLRLAGPTVMEYSPTGGIRYALLDHLGSVRGFVGALGTGLGRRAFDAYGLTRANSIAALAAEPGSIGFTGEREGGDGTVYLRARHYAPDSGRFLQRDTFEGFAARGQSLDRYSYVENRAMVGVDPTGHQLVLERLAPAVAPKPLPVAPPPVVWPAAGAAAVLGTFAAAIKSIEWASGEWSDAQDRLDLGRQQYAFATDKLNRARRMQRPGKVCSAPAPLNRRTPILSDPDYYDMMNRAADASEPEAEADPDGAGDGGQPPQCPKGTRPARAKALSKAWRNKMNEANHGLKDKGVNGHDCAHCLGGTTASQGGRGGEVLQNYFESLLNTVGGLPRSELADGDPGNLVQKHLNTLEQRLSRILNANPNGEVKNALDGEPGGKDVKDLQFGSGVWICVPIE
jgi:RHS repeat-associated protein